MPERSGHAVSGGLGGPTRTSGDMAGAPLPSPKVAQKKTARTTLRPCGQFLKDSGNTYSRTFGTTIGSGSLTTVFGMGTGVTFQICSPEIP